MSDVKVLSAKQQRSAISNVKKKKKAPLRNVYGDPHKRYWPTLNSEDCKVVLHLLNKSFSLEKADKSSTKINLVVEKNLDSITESSETKQTDIISEHLVVGLRKIISAIEKGNLKCLLLANEVEPPSLGHIIGDLASTHNVPYVAVPNFKSFLKDLLGFKSWCLGIRASTNHFDELCTKVQSVVKIQEPKNRCQDSINIEELKQTSSSNAAVRKATNITDLHLFRTDKSRRIFVPCSAQDPEKSASFLSFSKDTASMSTPMTKLGKSQTVRNLGLTSTKSTQSPRYFEKVELLPLQVKRFQENPNKQKWKKSKCRSSGIVQPAS